MKKILIILYIFHLVNSSPVVNHGMNIEIPPILLQLSPNEFGPMTTNLTISDGDVVIYFRNRNTDEEGVKIDSPDSGTLTNAGFSQKKTVFVIHGWQNDHISAVNQEVGSAYLAAEDVNLFVVDWSKIAKLGYVYAQSNVAGVGTAVGEFINNMVSNTNLAISLVHLVGHSLGAHVAGIAGAQTGGLVASIVGLDPAGPLFSIDNKDNRLDSSDAVFVQAIHTCAGLLGIGASVGHADYWPNGGAQQSGCNNDVVGTCRHSRAYLYFAESLKSGNFISKRCNNYDEFTGGNCQDGSSSYMGQANIDLQASGNYYLYTNDATPFAKG